MIQIIGLLVGAYILARCLAEATANPDGSIHGIGRFGYIVAFLVSAFFVFVIATSTLPH